MLAFLTRRRDTPAPATAPTTEAPAQPADNVLMRFLTHGGATVTVTGSGRYGAEDCRWKCLGCGASDERVPRYDWLAREKANGHAAACRAMPKPNTA